VIVDDQGEFRAPGHDVIRRCGKENDGHESDELGDWYRLPGRTKVLAGGATLRNPTMPGLLA
jgi:hypothetical protein